jgi:DNA-binding NarL/FixJ family response regulator
MVRLACEADPELEVVGEVGTGEEALAMCADLRPDVLVLDLVLPGIDGFEVARRVTDGGGGPRILVISGRTDTEAVFTARRLGLAGYLPKTLFVEHITDAIRAVARGETVYTPEQERAAVEGLGDMLRRARERSRVSAALTERELDVLRLMAQSLSNKQVARRLNISTKTVETHISAIYRKLDATNRVAAVARAIALGIVDDSPAPIGRPGDLAGGQETEKRAERTSP